MNTTVTHPFFTSLRAVIQDQTVQPKLQCLMMDPSFSMVTVQSEDSGIMWETAFSHCSIPRTTKASDRGFLTKTECHEIPTSRHAGKITFIMDKAYTVGKKKDKGHPRERKHTVASQDLLTDRPAMVEVSMPNMTDVQSKKEKTTNPRKEREQRLFRLVSEGSEILNIVVPPKVASVDEEESKKLIDNLAFIEESSTVQTDAQPVDIDSPVMVISEPKPQQTDTYTKQKELQDFASVPPLKLTHKGTGNDTDYFDMFTLLDGHSSEGSDKKEDKHHQQHSAEVKDLKHTMVKPVTKTKESPPDQEEPISTGEIAHELLDEVFYGGTQKHNHSQPGEECQGDKDELLKSLQKESGCALFGNEDTFLTPIFLSQGPPKIIDPCLLEEPKAMAFLYTDLYEDSFGTKTAEEDTVSLASEKSFHSKESDSDSKGYLEKFVLKDETPLVEIAQTITGADKTDGFRMWSEEMFELSKLNQIEKEPENDPEEEITDFLRNSGSSSPCEDVEQQNESLEENIVIKSRQVKFEDEVAQKQKKEIKTGQAAESTQGQNTEPPLESALEETEMTGKLLTDKKPLEDIIQDLNDKQEITSKDTSVSIRSITAPNMQVTEQQSSGLSLGSVLGQTSPEAVETEQDMRGDVQREVETVCSTDEE